MSRSDVIEAWPYVPAVVNWYRGGAWSYHMFGGDGWVSAVATDAGGTVWVGTSRGGMDMDQDGQPEDREPRKTDGGLWLTTDGSEWVNWTPANSPLVSDDIEVIAVGPHGDVWIGTNGWGLMRFEPAADDPQTLTPIAFTPTPRDATPPPTLTPTATPTRMVILPSPTKTTTPTATQTNRRPAYMPLIAVNRRHQILVEPTATVVRSTTVPAPALPAPSPTPDITPELDQPTFACSNWCVAARAPGMHRQVVTSNAPADDWRMYLSGLFIGVLTEETPTRAVIEVPAGHRVRVDALFGAVWMTACDSVVECSLP
jgi:hypothetical protein